MPTALIVGASRGLGLGMAEEYLKRGWDVIATTRGPSALDGRAETGVRLRVERLEATDWAGIDALVAKLGGTKIDLLFVNAGIMDPGGPIGEVDPDAFVQLMLVNSLAPLRIIDRFAGLVAPTGTIGAMSSHLGSIAASSGGYEAYRMSKAALNMGLKTVAGRLAGEGRTFIAAAPGWVRTDLGGPEASLGVEDSIPRLVDAIERRREAGGTHYIDYEDRDLAW